jgi:hypothetical protein
MHVFDDRQPWAFAQDFFGFMTLSVRRELLH